MTIESKLKEMRQRADEAREFPFSDYVHDSQGDVPRLLEAVEAVRRTVEQYPVPHKRDDPTAEIAIAIEEFGDAVLDALTEKLGADDEQ